MPDGLSPSRFDLQLAFRVKPDVANKLFAVKEAIEQGKLDGSKLPLSTICKIALVTGLDAMMVQYGIKGEAAPHQMPTPSRRRKRPR
jgi:hypothetical protein